MLLMQFLIMSIFLVQAKINVCFLQADGSASYNHSPDFRTRFSHDGFDRNVDVFAARKIDIRDFGQFCSMEKVSEMLGRDVVGMIQQQLFQVGQLGKALKAYGSYVFCMA